MDSSTNQQTTSCPDRSTGTKYVTSFALKDHGETQKNTQSNNNKITTKLN